MHIVRMRKLDEWMTEHEVDDAELARLARTDRTTISRIRRGKQRPSLDLAARLAEATDNAVTPNDFAGIDASEAA